MLHHRYLSQNPKVKIPIPSNLEILEENKNQHFQLFRVNIVEPSTNLHFVTICTRKNGGEGNVRRGKNDGKVD